MEIKVTTRNPDDFDDYEPNDLFKLEIDGDEVLSISETMEPEDATFGRDLSGILDLPEILSRVFKAGANRDTLDIVYEYEEDE